jgi:hypothetical protein
LGVDIFIFDLFNVPPSHESPALGEIESWKRRQRQWLREIAKARAHGRYIYYQQ